MSCRSLTDIYLEIAGMSATAWRATGRVNWTHFGRARCRQPVLPAAMPCRNGTHGTGETNLASPEGSTGWIAPEGLGRAQTGADWDTASCFRFLFVYACLRSALPTKARPAGTPGGCRRRAEPPGGGPATAVWKNWEARFALPRQRLGKLDLQPRPQSGEGSRW